MNGRQLRTWLSSSALVAMGCGDDGSRGDAAMPPFDCVVDEIPDDGGRLPAEVLEIVERRCHGCHGTPPDPEKHAPMALVTWADFQGCHDENQEVPDYVRAGIRINSERLPMPPIREPQLTDEERDTLNGWIDRGAPAAD